MWKWLWTEVFRGAPGIFGTFAFFAVAEATLVGLAFGVGSTLQDHFLNSTMVVVGIPAGWTVAVVLTPDTSDQEKRFQRGGAAISALATGYLVGKSEDAVKRLLLPEFLFRPLVGFRTVAFLGSFLVSLILVFVHREYQPKTRRP